MTQTDKNCLNDVKSKIEEIKARLESYEKVDATLSNMTLLRTLAHLERADEALEQGFVKNACEEINCKL